MIPRSARLLARLALLGVLALPAPARGAPAELEFFHRPGCPHCERAEAWLGALAQRHPELEIARHDIVASAEALERLRTLAARHGVEPVGVPAFYLRGELFVGFDSAETTGAMLERRLAADESGASSSSSSDDDDDGRVELPLFGPVSVRALGLPLFTVAVGLVDGFNPCAMWVLLFMLSLLVHLKSRRRMAAIAGTFVLVSGLVYFAFMAAWLNFFLLVGAARVVQVVLGVVAIAVGAVHIKDFFALGRGISLSIPERAKPSIARRVRRILAAEQLAGAIAAVVVLALMVNLVELLCTAGLPALYTRILTGHALPAWQYYAYLAVYNVAYMLDDGIMVAIAVVTLGSRKLQERGGRILKLLSGVVILGLGLLLLFAPRWLSW